MKKHLTLLCFTLTFSWFINGQTIVHITNPDTWSAKELSNYVGQTIRFDVPFYICNNYSYKQSSYIISPRRIYSPTNQTLPGSLAYQTIVSANQTGEITLTGINEYHRMGEQIIGLTVRVNSTTSISAVGSQTFKGNTRADMEAGMPSVDLRGKHNLLVCAMNLEYYLVDNLGTGFGPDNTTASNKQHTKIMAALSHIPADIFGFVEVEQGQAALKKLATSLSTLTGRNYSYINDGGSSYGSYTKSGYVYCTETVEPYGNLTSNNTAVSNRKKMIAFTDKASGERFIFSINHFKAKSGTGTGLDADQGDGQGIFNATRVREAESVLSYYNSQKNYYGDEDILIMGDLNAYAKEDPIMLLLEDGMTDLHRYFHADSSYSYVYHDQAGYLDHALANETMLTQITGMTAYHINSDEHDGFTYDKSSDLTMFRCSDHDPILVGLSLGKQMTPIETADYEQCTISILEGLPVIKYAKNGYFRIYNISGTLVTEGHVANENYTVDRRLSQGFYILNIYVENRMKQFKFMIY